MANTKYKFEFLAINKTRNSFNQIKTGLKGIQKTAMFTTKAMAGTTAAFAGAAAGWLMLLLAPESYSKMHRFCVKI